MKMAFDLGSADFEGRWSWGLARDWCKIQDPAKNGDCDIRSLLKKMSALTWAEITHQQTGPTNKRKKKHHSESLDSIHKEAQKRWRDLEREEDERFRFRGTGKLRLWGVRKAAVFNMIWWDPDHAIHLSEARFLMSSLFFYRQARKISA